MEELDPVIGGTGTDNSERKAKNGKISEKTWTAGAGSVIAGAGTYTSD